MSSFPKTPLTRQITRHWHLEFLAQASKPSGSELEPCMDKLQSDSSRSMADDLLDQLRRSHRMFGESLDNDPVRCPVKGCSQRHGVVNGEHESPDDAFYNEAKNAGP